MKRILLALFVVLFLVPVAGCSVSGFEVSPDSPVQGDTLRISIHADPGEAVPVSLSYSGEVDVSGGKYLIELSGVKIPGGPKSVKATVDGVENLKVAVKMPLLGWVTISKEASGGKATISQSTIPSGTYDIEVKGDALSGVSSVDLSFTASITLTMDGDGDYTYSYNTGSIPAGTIKVTVDGDKETIILSSGSSGGGSIGGGASPPVADFTVSGERVVGEPLVFTSSSRAVLGVLTEESWDFGDGGSGSGGSVSHVYDVAGEYAVRLSVLTSYGLEDEKVLTIIVDEVENAAPVVVGGGSRGCLPGQSLVFRSQSSDVDGVIVEYLWDFGDGSGGVGRVVSHSWDVPGVYTVSHTVVDDRGVAASGYTVVSVESVGAPVVFMREVLVETALFQYFGDVGASITVSGNNSVLYLVEYDGAPGDGMLPRGQLGDVLDIVVSDPDSVVWPIYFELEYPAGVVDNVTETSLGLYYYSDGVWSRCVRTGVDPGRGVVWANLTRGELTGSPLTVGVVEPLPYYVLSGFSLESLVVEEDEQVVSWFNASNSGDRGGNIVCLVYLDGVPVASRTIHLDSGESKPVSVSFMAPSRGLHLVRFGDAVKELTVLPPTVPDLACSVTVDEGLVEPAMPVVVSYRVDNVGNRTASDFVAVLSVGGIKVSSNRVMGLAVGERLAWNYTWVGSVEGEYSVEFVVDAEESLFEVDEGNNVASGLIVVEKPFQWVLGLGLFAGICVFAFIVARKLDLGSVGEP